MEKKEEHKEAKAEPKAEDPKEVKDEHKAAKEEAKTAKEEPKATKEEHKKAEPKEDAKDTAADKEKLKVDEKPVKAPQKSEAEAPKGPRIGIVVAGLGLSRSSTEQMLKMPSAISYSFSPYASDLAQWIKKAVNDNHEVYVDIPLEPKDYPQSDPGPYALLLNLENDKNMERLNQVLKTGEGYKGLVSGPDEHFTEGTRAYEWLLDAMKAKKLTFYFVARAGNKQFTQELEKSKRTEAVGIDVVLDEKLTNDAIDAQLAQAETVAQKYGYATILARPYPISAQRIQEWMKTLGPKNIHLVPLSQAKAQ